VCIGGGVEEWRTVVLCLQLFQPQLTEKREVPREKVGGLMQVS
jgi:hypothetical protein